MGPLDRRPMDQERVPLVAGSHQANGSGSIGIGIIYVSKTWYWMDTLN